MLGFERRNTMGKRKISQEEIEREHMDLALIRAAKETTVEQDRVFHEKRREAKNLFLIMDTIHPSFYDTFASKLSIEALESTLKQLDRIEPLYSEFCRHLSNQTIVKILNSIWNFPTFLEKMPEDRVNDFINSEAKDWCVANFSDFEFPEQLEMFSRFSEKGLEKFFSEILENHTEYISEISYVFRKLEAEGADEIFEKMYEMPAALLSQLIEMGELEMNGILLRKMSENKITAICCQTESDKMYKVLEKSDFEVMYSCQKPSIICHKLTEQERQELFAKLQKNAEGKLKKILLFEFECLMAFYHAVSPKEKTYILDEVLLAEDFGRMYEKLSKEEQDEVFELILSEDISEEKGKKLRQQAVDFLEKKENLSYFEKITLKDLKSNS